jgi:hypothetical protein
MSTACHNFSTFDNSMFGAHYVMTLTAYTSLNFNVDVTLNTSPYEGLDRLHGYMADAGLPLPQRCVSP